MRVGGTYFSLTSAALRAFGADAVRECGWWSVHSGTSITGCSDLPLCKKYALKRTTPSIAADRCRYRVRTLARLHLSSALRSNSGKRITAKQFSRSASPRTETIGALQRNTHRTARIPSTAQAQARSAVQRSVIFVLICTHETLSPHQRGARSIKQPA